nr:MAG TPA: hypothetical protein [Caudoviricetes sp.]DAQ06773.1 MAG TPA: hypothetical protein [Caudoviricetes sp.]
MAHTNLYYHLPKLVQGRQIVVTAYQIGGPDSSSTTQ